MTQIDPETNEQFSIDEMVDQVAIFFLAGHETSASALAWALYLLATHPEWQDKVAKEAAMLYWSNIFIAENPDSKSLLDTIPKNSEINI